MTRSTDKPLSMAKAAHQFAAGLVLLIIGGLPLAVIAGVAAAVAVRTYQFTVSLF